MLARVENLLVAGASPAGANSFQPPVAASTNAAEILGVSLDEVLFVTNHAFDPIGAKVAGMHTAFITRHHRPFGLTPHQPDLIDPSGSRTSSISVTPGVNHLIRRLGWGRESPAPPPSAPGE